MHPNSAFAWDDRDELRAFASAIGFGTLFATTPDGPRVAHVPFVFTADDRIGFHLARGNALAKHLDGGEALFFVNGANAYISPDWYGIPDQVPTWNYLALELEGRVERMEEEWLINQVDLLSAQHEDRLLPKTPWTRDKMRDGAFAAMLRGIIGFEMSVTMWRGTSKLGQTKAPAVRAAAADGVEAAGSPVVARLMRNIAP